MNQPITKAGTSCLAIAAATCGAATEARADSMQGLKARVDLLVRKMADMERRQAVAPTAAAIATAAAASAVTAAATKGPFKLPGSDTSVNLIWSPVAQTNLRLEYIYARREVQSGDAGTSSDCGPRCSTSLGGAISCRAASVQPARLKTGPDPGANHEASD